VAGAFETVTLTFAALAVLPPESRTIALRVWGPLVDVVVFQEIAYGAATTGEPTFAPSSRNCTVGVPELLVAVAVTAAVPETTEPPTGAVRETVGGVMVPPDGGWPKLTPEVSAGPPARPAVEKKTNQS